MISRPGDFHPLIRFNPSQAFFWLRVYSEGKEIQSNAVDNESVKMPTSHGVVQGYNAQALVDSKHQVILAAEAFSSQDHENLKPMVEGAKKNVVAIGKDETYFQGRQLTTDPNYHSLNSLTVCRDEKIDAYIPDIQYRTRDPRFADHLSERNPCNARIWSPGGTLDEEGSPQIRFFDSLVGRFLAQLAQC
ncbi:MAG: hypothetical protein HY867_05170 [Chloroflexi bacterium]|nr:hypothetical protein [Chloroflexota bacterium]